MNFEYLDVINNETMCYFSEVTGEQFIITKQENDSWSVYVSEIDDDGEMIDTDSYAASSLSSAIAIIENRKTVL